MSLATPAVTETLCARPRRWLSRLWVRVSLVLLLIFAINLFAWWLPRRTMVSVWWNGGTVTGDKDHERTNAVLAWFDPTSTGWVWSYYDTVNRFLVWTCTDIDITVLSLSGSKVTDLRLFGLKRLSKLKAAILHDRQIGAGLADLRDCLELRDIAIKSVSDRRLAELRQLPQLQSLSLYEPQSGDIGLESLTALPSLNSLFIDDCKYTDEVLEALPELPLLERLTVHECTGFGDENFYCLHRLPNLKYLHIEGQLPLGDFALEHVSQLTRLESLSLRTRWEDVTDEGLAKLARMKSLRNIHVVGVKSSPSQLQRLRKALPSCNISTY